MAEIMLVGRTSLTITAGLLAGHLPEDEGQFHEQRQRPIHWNVLAHDQSGVDPREYGGLLMVDHMDVAEVRGSHWRGLRRAFKSTKPVQATIPFCQSDAVLATAVVVKRVPLHMASSRSDGLFTCKTRHVVANAPKHGEIQRRKCTRGTPTSKLRAGVSQRGFEE